VSYNIGSWEQVECSLTFPAALLDDEDLDIISDVRYSRPTIDGIANVEIDLGMNGELTGTLAGDVVTVKELRMTGEGSGSHFDDLAALLEQTQGAYSAVLVWEDGDSLSLFTVDNGAVENAVLNIPALLRENAELKERLAALERQGEEL
jgi:hypothetical protein